VKTFETRKSIIAAELTRMGYKSTRRAEEGRATMFVFVVEDDFVAPKQKDLRRESRKKRSEPVLPAPKIEQLVPVDELMLEDVLTFEAMLDEVVKSEPAPVPVPRRKHRSPSARVRNAFRLLEYDRSGHRHGY
jgi:hypothetical protein